MNLAPPRALTVDAFFAWAAEQPSGRYELHGGEVVAMAPERVRHAVVKLAAVNELARAIREAGRDCVALPDGVTVVVDQWTAYEPDAVVQCGGSLDYDGVVADRPLIVVEVASPSTSRIDALLKLGGYGQIESVQHYLIVDTTRRHVVWSRRAGDRFETWIGGGTLRLDPPGIDVDTDAFFESLPPET